MSDDEATGFDPGPTFNPDDAPDEGVLGKPDAAVLPKGLNDAKIAKALRDLTGGLNQMAGERVGADLTLTEFEAGMIAPGIRKYAESRPQVAAVLDGNEYAKAAVGLGIASWRIAGERAETLRQLAEADPVEYVNGSDEQAPIIFGGA